LLILKAIRENFVRKKITTTVYITARQSEQLKTLHKRTKIPVAEYIRQGIDLILKKNQSVLPRQLSLYENVLTESDTNS